MDQTVRIILNFQDNASGAVQTASAAIGGALGRLGSGAVGALGSVKTGFSGMVAGVQAGTSLVMGHVTNLVNHMKWASLFVGTAAVGIGSSFVQMAGGLEQTRIGFEILLKDQGKVQDALSFIQKWALETPFSVTEATDSFKRFLAVTGDLQLTKKYLTSLGDAVVATGGNINEFNFAARAMTQIQAMSKVRAQEMYQLVNANIPAFDILAKAVQDGSLKVEGLNVAMTTTAGVSKKLTTEYTKASAGIGEMNDKLAIAKQRLKEAEGNAKTKTSTLMSLKNTVQNYEQNLTKANGTISQYTSATANSNKVISTQKMSLDDIKGKLQDIGTLNISGAEAAAVFQKYFEQAYGGAAAKSTTSLIGKMGVLKDQITFGAAALIGYNVLTGESYGLYKKLGEAVDAINSFLKYHKKQLEDIGRILNSQTALYGLLGVALGIFIGFLGGILAPVLMAGVVFGTLGIALGKLIEGLKAGSPAATMFAGAIGTVGAILASTMIAAKIQGIITAIKTLVFTFGPMAGNFLMGAALIGAGIALIITNWEKAKTSGSALALVILGIGMAVAGIIPIILSFNATLLANPIGLVIITVAALTAGIIALYTQTDFLKTKTQLVEQAQYSLKIANDNLRISTDALKDSQDRLANAHIGVQGAQLAVERSTLNLTEVLRTHTTTSLEGREAQYQLDLATRNLTSAQNEEKTAQEAATKAEQDNKDKKADIIKAQDSLTAANNKQKTSWDNITDAIGGAIGKINNWIDKVFEARKFGVVGGLEKIFSGQMQHGGIVSGMPGQAVPIIAHGGERVIPTSGIDVNNRGGGGGGVTINMNGNITLDSEDRIRQLADRIFSILNRQNELARYGLR